MSSSGLQLEWFGCATFRVRVNGLTLFFDTYLDRPPGVPEVGLTAGEVEAADFVFISHAHFDHMLGVDTIATATGATIVCSYEVARVLRSNGVPDAQILAVSGGEPVDCGSRRPRARVSVAALVFVRGCDGRFACRVPGRPGRDRAGTACTRRGALQALPGGVAARRGVVRSKRHRIARRTTAGRWRTSSSRPMVRCSSTGARATGRGSSPTCDRMPRSSRSPVVPTSTANRTRVRSRSSSCSRWSCSGRARSCSATTMRCCRRSRRRSTPARPWRASRGTRATAPRGAQLRECRRDPARAPSLGERGTRTSTKPACAARIAAAVMSTRPNARQSDAHTEMSPAGRRAATRSQSGRSDKSVAVSAT